MESELGSSPRVDGRGLVKIEDSISEACHVVHEQALRSLPGVDGKSAMLLANRAFYAESKRLTRLAADAIADGGIAVFVACAGGGYTRVTRESHRGFFDQADRWRLGHTTKEVVVRVPGQASISREWGRFGDASTRTRTVADNIDWKGLFVSARWIDELSSPVASHASNGTPEGWPWGNYTTPELDRLAAAVAEFWARWDGAHNTAPKNDAVIAWLKERGMSENIARAVASLIRSPDVPPGPRRTSKTGAGATSAQRR